jgi:hypothetical protein
MVGSRTATAVVGLLASVAISLVLYWQFDTLAVFLFLPVVPFLFSRRDRDDGRGESRVRTCPECGFRTDREGFAYCPRDGARLERDRG